MFALGEQMTGSLHECIGLGLQVPEMALFDFGCALGQPGKESIDFLAHLGCRTKADVCRHFRRIMFAKGGNKCKSGNTVR
jgi:hypothetical protein